LMYDKRRASSITQQLNIERLRRLRVAWHFTVSECF